VSDSDMSAHTTCPDFAWQNVTCDRCRRKFQCTPWDDFYCAADSPDHCCESCLVRGHRIAYVDPEAPLAAPVFRTPAGGEQS